MEKVSLFFFYLPLPPEKIAKILRIETFTKQFDWLKMTCTDDSGFPSRLQ
jgi:hypothetical protein